MKRLIVGMILLASGCQSDCSVLREGMDQGTRTIRANEKLWASKLVAYPKGMTDPRTGKPSTGKNQAELITPLTPEQYEQERKAHSEYENLVGTDRQRGSK